MKWLPKFRWSTEKTLRSVQILKTVWNLPFQNEIIRHYVIEFKSYRWLYYIGIRTHSIKIWCKKQEILLMTSLNGNEIYPWYDYVMKSKNIYNLKGIDQIPIILFMISHTQQLNLHFSATLRRFLAMSWWKNWKYRPCSRWVLAQYSSSVAFGYGDPVTIRHLLPIARTPTKSFLIALAVKEETTYVLVIMQLRVQEREVRGNREDRDGKMHKLICFPNASIQIMLLCPIFVFLHHLYMS